MSIYAQNLCYTFPTNKIGLFDVNLDIKPRSRVLLVGPNGAGKSTLLRVLAGQKLIKQGKLLLNGTDPFELASASSCGVITYLGTEWASNQITKRDIPVTVLIDSVGGTLFKERRDQLINMLDIDITWRMNQCSDGERRRVQLCMGLLKPWDLLLLDEVTVDLDVLVRARLLAFLQQETESRNATIVYATHIFDGLGEWPTEIVHFRGGCIVAQHSMDFVSYGDQEENVKETKSTVEIAKSKSFYPLALHWLSQDLDLRGERTEDKTRPKYEDLSRLKNDQFYDDKNRVTSYFQTTRHV
ncbi:hypothetical protein OGAPHI_001769 [Ogataea philodendri]|uniref:ABC transporter domain-containing protein n=2 Tax=Ogataea TaxID=461281 RepID=A0A9P8T7C3_9ASCO|nr:uncharacterized protein OGAPHI_001769 [Ogataea philodendri]KAH3668015.1 hypothetical protein OGAPHI_001769 [Ogataea philodendri]